MAPGHFSLPHNARLTIIIVSLLEAFLGYSLTATTRILTAFPSQEAHHIPPPPPPPSSSSLPEMSPQRSASRAGSSAKSPNPPPPPPSSNRSVKRRRSESPIYLSTAVLVTPEEALEARQRFFDALGKGNPYPGMQRSISSADHLTEAQLKKCFDILHACGTATSDTASLDTTRGSVEGYLDAIFNDWTSDSKDALVKPEMDFLVEAEVVAGVICTTPASHADISACKSHGSCTAQVCAAVSYSCNPAMLKMEFTVVDPFNGQPDPFCPLGRADIRWMESDWREELRGSLESRLVSKVHRHNKHLAVWHARKLVRDWSKGSVELTTETANLGYVGRYEVSLVLAGCLGETAAG